MSSPILPKSINVNNFKYSEVKILASGAKSVYINYGTGKLRIQTPVMFLPYGVNEGGFEDKNAKVDIKKNGDKKADKKYDLTLSFKGHEENPKIEAFLSKLKDIENKIIDDAFEYRQSWFKDDFDDNKAFVARLFSPIIKIDKDKNTGKVVGKYPPTIRFKLPYDNENDRFSFNSFNMNGETINLLDIITKLKSGKAQLIVELNSIWFAGGKFGCTWKLITGKFQRSINNDISFIEDSDTEKVKDDDEEDESDKDNEEEIKEIVSNLNDTTIDNSDDEAIIDDNNYKSQEQVEKVPAVEKKKGRGATKK
jgi:hypothetical protein